MEIKGTRLPTKGNVGAVFEVAAKVIIQKLANWYPPESEDVDSRSKLIQSTLVHIA